MKYELDESIAFVGNMKQGHLHRFILAGARMVLRNAYKILNRDKDITYEIVKVGKFRIFVIIPNELGNGPHPCNINIHGGAFVFRGWYNHFLMCSEYAKRTKSIVIYTDYRLAYCNKYHTCVDDCISTYNWIIDNKNKYNIDTNNIIISGDSAGGYLALELNEYVNKNTNNVIKGLMLIYPVVDPTESCDSIKKYTDTPVWNSIANKDMWNIYLKGNKEESYLNKDLSYIKNCYIETCEYDCLHDEGLLLAKKLMKTSNVVLNETLKTAHGYDTKLEPKIVVESLNKRIDYLNSIIRK